MIVCFWCEGMSCYRSNFSGWKRQREASTSSRAATGPSGCSVCLTTACFLRSGLQLQRPSSSPVISVSGIFRCDWNLYRCLSWLVLSPFLFLFWKLNPKIIIELWVMFPSCYNCVETAGLMTLLLCACHISVWLHGRRKNLCSGARQRGGGARICAVPSKAPLSTASYECRGIASFWASMRHGDIENIDYLGFKPVYWRVIFRLWESQYFSSWLFHHRPQPPSFHWNLDSLRMQLWK